jgi:tight adherence protein C
MPITQVTNVYPPAVVFGLLTGLGIWSVVAAVITRGHTTQGRQSVLLRIASTLHDVSADARRTLRPQATDPVTIFGRLAHPSLVTLSEIIDRLMGGEQATATLLARAGRSTKPADYRMDRLVRAAGGAGIGLVVMIPGIFGNPTSSLLPSVLSMVIGGVAGAWWLDHRLRREASKRHSELLDQFPTMVELLALTLSAGQSLPHALERVASRSRGALGEEWRKVLTRVNLGAPLGPTLKASAWSMGVSEISALVDHLVFAMERGAPLVDIVRTHSNDARADKLRSIVERSGKAEIAMLVPLVLLILPITVLFAVWPSLQALQLSI